jgi:deoxyuridine 5'-triphosphate nucleotidohydrolase
MEMSSLLSRIVSTEETAYLLGWLLSDATLKNKDSLVIQGKLGEDEILAKLHHILNSELKLEADLEHHAGSHYLTLKPPLSDFDQLFGVEALQDGQIEQRLEALPDVKRWAVLRGLFDACGFINEVDAQAGPCCSLTLSTPFTSALFRNLCVVKGEQLQHTLVWRGSNLIDMLGKLYDAATIYLSCNRTRYLEWASWVNGLSSFDSHGQLKNFQWAKSNPKAFPPFKQRASDSGFDLTVIELIEQIGDVQVYDTGIRVQPDYGWYFIIAPRSSLFKHGYIPAITTGIIDRSYIGSIKVPLLKFNKQAADLQLPARVMQIVPTPIVHVDFVEVSEFEETYRSSGGLGSSGGHVYSK